MSPSSDKRPIRLGVSACLLGDEVRYDGGHKRDTFLMDVLGPFVEWVKVCPEVESGMGTPRESIRLVDQDGPLRLLTVKTGVDHTDAMTTYAEARVRRLAAEDLCGYVLKKDSPSCGMTRVKVYGAGAIRRPGREWVSSRRALLARFPDLPVEEEGRLLDPRLRENFIERVFAYRRLTRSVRVALDDRRSRAVPHRAQARADGTLVAGVRTARTPGGRRQRPAARDRARGLQRRIHGGAVHHRHDQAAHQRSPAHGRLFQARCSTPDRATSCSTTIEDYRKGLVPLVAPLTLLRHHVRQQEVRYLAGQVYLEPHPKELMLRNHV